MREKGLPKEEILRILEERLKADMKYESGHILGSMCTKPHEFALEIFNKYHEKNLGDPGLFPGTYKLEHELINDIGALFHGENITGSIVTGGSEANIIAMRIAKKLNPNIKHPEVVCSKNIHMSFYKAADLMGLKIKEAKLTDNYEPDMGHFESLINENTIAVVGVAGTTSLGVVEPIDKIGEIAEENNLFFHVDAAFGGFVLPFMEDLNYKFSPYDFRVKSVSSITADPHKMGTGMIPGGGIFIREERIIENFGFSIPYLAGGAFKHLALTGTRSGASVVSFWALYNYLGREGFRQIVKKCWENTLYLKKLISEIEGIEIANKPVINIVGIKPTAKVKNSICRVDDELRKRGWALGVFRDLNLARIVVMPHITKEHIDEFVVVLKQVVKEIVNK